MRFKTYLKYRKMFESRYNPNEVGNCTIDDMKRGIRNCRVFFAIYGHDRIIAIHCNVSSLDKNGRYIIPFKGRMGSRINIRDKKRSLFDKFPKSYDKLLEAINKNPDCLKIMKS